jgi:membrane-associated phospholipid phosphatase
VVEDVADPRAGVDPWPRVRRQVAVVYFVVLTTVVILRGVPTGRASLMSIVITGLAITCIGRGWRALLRMVVDWLPFTMVLVVYDVSRGLATWASLPLHESDVAHAESSLFGGTIPTVWLQDHLYMPSSVHWFDAVMTLVYTSHFLATPILAAVLWLRDRTAWIAYITRVVVLAFSGLVTYVLFPEAPPWMAARDGLIDPVARLSARGWMWLHLGNVNEVLETAQRDGSNPVAAMPSLHAAFAVLVALVLMRRCHYRWRPLLAAYPAAMGFALVYLGEHYVLDILAGVAYAVAVDWGVGRWERSRATRASAIAAEDVILCR